MKNQDQFTEYLAWLIRNAYKESGASVNCENFVLAVPIGAFSDGDLPDSTMGWNLKVTSVSAEYEILLLTSVDDSYDKGIRRWLKAFYEMQSISGGFYDGQLWRMECKITKELEK